MSSVLITGGAGFIGRRLALSLREAGFDVSVLDTLHPQVHTDAQGTVQILKRAGVVFTHGDVRDSALVADLVSSAGAATIVHLAAETGTGQSYDEPGRYCDVNVTGTARLIEGLRIASARGVKIRRVIFAGSRAVYGEGACRTQDGRLVTAVPRQASNMAAGDFAVRDDRGHKAEPKPSSAATTAPAPASIYASTKLMQEYLLRQGFEGTGAIANILRLQNVYGAGQSLHNPYTGVLSIFTRQLMDGKILNIFEDGNIIRDFVHVSDVVAAFRVLCEAEPEQIETLDIGSGVGSSILDVAQTIADALRLDGERWRISGDFRPGDVRHAVADISAAQERLSWRPRMALKDGLLELVAWARGEG